MTIGQFVAGLFGLFLLVLGLGLIALSVVEHHAKRAKRESLGMHNNACTGSNEAGQPGSRYTNRPLAEQE